MFQTLKNAWSMPELRKKMLYTLFIILIFRFGSCIPVPFIDTALLSQYFEQASVNGSMLGYLDMFTGGGLSRATIFAMSITPYINASIILQLLTVAIPALERMVKDGGEEGREKIASCLVCSRACPTTHCSATVSVARLCCLTPARLQL